jgi:hypothetical protein
LLFTAIGREIVHFCQETKRPLGLTELKGLVIDREEKNREKHYVPQTICMSLDRTLFYRIKSTEHLTLSDDYFKTAVEVVYEENGTVKRDFIIERPGATQLLVELDNYASPMIYSSETDEFIEAALLALSTSKINQDTDECSSHADVYMELYIWSREQCIPTSNGFLKSLGILSHVSDDGINDHWFIDSRPDLVDFSSHVVAVSDFTGDLNDRELYRIIDQIFIN